MKRGVRVASVVLACVALLSSCRALPEEEAAVEKAASVEKIAGSNLTRVKVTAKAAERLGIETAPVREASAGKAKRKVIAYGALIYDADGAAFVYTNPQPLTFVRARINVLSIANDLVFFSGGPAAGTSIVTVGVPELFGIDSGVGGNE
jgi:hypothetical protein